MELAHLSMPYETVGRSLVPVLKNPALKKWNHVAYSYFQQGISLRNDQYRLTKYFRKEVPVIELYDHKKDPYENNNVAGSSEITVTRLLPLLEKGNTGLYDSN